VRSRKHAQPATVGLLRVGPGRKWSQTTPYPAGLMLLLTTFAGGGQRQLGVKSMIRYSVAGVSRVARQVSWASGRRTASTRTLTICC
jgi:hypothetical protein